MLSSFPLFWFLTFTILATLPFSPTSERIVHNAIWALWFQDSNNFVCRQFQDAFVMVVMEEGSCRGRGQGSVGLLESEKVMGKNSVCARAQLRSLTSSSPSSPKLTVEKAVSHDTSLPLSLPLCVAAVCICLSVGRSVLPHT